MIEGAIFFVLAVTGARYAITKFIPEPMKLATAPAIGAFLAHLGLQTAEGIGLVVADIATVSFNAKNHERKECHLSFFFLIIFHIIRFHFHNFPVRNPRRLL